MRSTFPLSFVWFSTLPGFSSAFSEWGLPSITILYTKYKNWLSPPACFIPLMPAARSQGHTIFLVAVCCRIAQGALFRLPWRQWVKQVPSEKLGCSLALCPHPRVSQHWVLLTLCSRPTFCPAVPISPLCCWVQLQLLSQTHPSSLRAAELY